MNNEEKILAMLSEMKETMDKRFEQVDKRFEHLESDVTAIKVRLENEVTKKFNLLAEGQQAILDRLDQMPERRMEAAEEDVTVLKAVTKEHSRDIAELKKVK